jgi:hypothetical protein
MSDLSVALARAASPCTCAEWTRLIGHSWHAPDCPVPIETAYRERVLALIPAGLSDFTGRDDVPSTSTGKRLSGSPAATAAK